MNYMLHHYLPGSNPYNPAIIFTTNDPSKDEKMVKPSVQKDLTGKKESLHIILADDDADDRELFGEVIEETGLNVKLQYAEDGKDLLNILSSSHQELPSMIFLDLNMPNKNGKECLEAIRKSDRLKNIPVIIYSTSSSPIDIDDTFEKGANLYVRKPTSYSDLLSMAKNVLLLDWLNYQPKSSKANFVFSSKTR